MRMKARKEVRNEVVLTALRSSPLPMSIATIAHTVRWPLDETRHVVKRLFKHHFVEPVDVSHSAWRPLSLLERMAKLAMTAKERRDRG